MVALRHTNFWPFNPTSLASDAYKKNCQYIFIQVIFTTGHFSSQSFKATEELHQYHGFRRVNIYSLVHANFCSKSDSLMLTILTNKFYHKFVSGTTNFSQPQNLYHKFQAQMFMPHILPQMLTTNSLPRIPPFEHCLYLREIQANVVRRFGLHRFCRGRQT